MMIGNKITAGVNHKNGPLQGFTAPLLNHQLPGGHQPRIQFTIKLRIQLFDNGRGIKPFFLYGRFVFYSLTLKTAQTCCQTNQKKDEKFKPRRFHTGSSAKFKQSLTFPA